MTIGIQTTIDVEGMTDAGEMTAEVANVAEEMIEGVANVAEEMTVVAKITDAIEEEITPTMIGNVQNVKIQILHSELNATDAENPKEEVLVAEEGITVEVVTAVAEIIEITVIIVPMTVVAKITDATEEEIKEITPTMIGNVKSAKIQTSHSELNATDVGRLREEVEPLAKTGKEMTEDPVTEERLLKQDLVIGIALNVENPILRKEMNALVVDARKE